MRTNYVQAVLRQDAEEIATMAYVAQIEGNNRAAAFLINQANSIIRQANLLAHIAAN